MLNASTCLQLVFSFVFTHSRTIYLFPLLHLDLLSEQNCEAKLQVYVL